MNGWFVEADWGQEGERSPLDAEAVLRHVAPDVTIGAYGTELEQTADLDLANALAGQVQDRTDLFERNPTAIGDVQCARLTHLGEIFVGEV